MGKKNLTSFTKIGRDAATGKFISVKEARKKTAIIETIKVGRDAATGKFASAKDSCKRSKCAQEPIEERPPKKK